MWRCDTCGEEDNEDSYKYCFSCGASMPEPGGAAPEPDEDEPDEDEQDEPTPSAAARQPEHAAVQTREPPRTREHDGGAHAAGAAGFGRASEPTAPEAAGRGVIPVGVSQEAADAIALLVRAEKFKTAEEAAAFLIDKGVESQSEYLYVLWQKLKEIERLREELRNLGSRI